MAVHVGEAAVPELLVETARTGRGSLLGSTPVRLIAIGVLVTAMLIATAIVTTVSVAGRQNVLAGVLTRSEPLSDAAQNLYGQLSVADAAASTAFLAGGLDPGPVRDQYTAAITAASTEVVRAANGLDASDADSRTRLAEISAALPVYTGIIETARANNRLGNPVGSAYLAEASSLMQGTILPRAEKLHSEKSGDVAAAQQQVTRLPWWSLALIVATIVVLIGTQAFLAKRTRRTVNPGMAFATLAVVGLLVWILAAGALSVTNSEGALARGAEPLNRLTTARIYAQQARSVETIGIARRGGLTDYDASYAAAISGLSAILEGLRADSSVSAERVDNSRALLNQWTSSHARMNDTVARGDFRAAVNIAVGAGPGDSADVFARLDSELMRDIDTARDQLRERAQRAGTVLRGLAVGASVLCGLSVLAVAAGLGIRLREYL